MQMSESVLGTNQHHASIPENAHGACVLAFWADVSALSSPGFWTQLPGQHAPDQVNQAHSPQPEFAPNPFLLISRSAPTLILIAERHREQKTA